MFKCHFILSEKPLLCTLTDKFTALLHVISLLKLQAWGDRTHDSLETCSQSHHRGKRTQSVLRGLVV